MSKRLDDTQVATEYDIVYQKLGSGMLLRDHETGSARYVTSREKRCAVCYFAREAKRGMLLRARNDARNVTSRGLQLAAECNIAEGRKQRGAEQGEEERKR